MDTNLITLAPALVLLPPAVAANVSLAPVARALLAIQPPARLMEPRDLSKFLRGLIQGAANNLGHRNALGEALDVMALAVTTAELIRLDFSGLKIAEIEQAFLRGGGGAYRTEGELELVSAPTFRRWLTAYQSARYDARKALDAASPLQGQCSNLPENHPVAIAWRVDYAARVVAQPALLTLPALSGGIGGAMANQLYEWLKAWGLFTGFRSPAVFQAWRDDALIEITKRPLPEGRHQRADFKAFVDALAEGTPPLSTAPIAAEANAACRNRCVVEWSADHADLSPEAVRGLLLDAATAYYPVFEPAA